MADNKFEICEEAKNEIQRFRDEIKALDSGARDMDDFKRFRLNNGIYGIRGKEDEHMIRIKLPFGNITSDQLDVVTDVAEEYTPTKLSHVTTRQAIQLHNLKRPIVPELLQRIHEAGMTSREACGNTVRNITADELAGIHPEEIFDVNPYADLLYRYFLRNPISQNLPRKFKIAFEGCANSDRARVGIHDLGFRATVREVNGEKEYGFITTVGGGLGSLPFAAHLLEEFCPLNEYLATTEALIRIFDRYGNRRDKNRARIKFVVKEWGIEEFRNRFLAEKRIVMSTSSGRHETFTLNWPEEKEPVITGKVTEGLPGPGYNEWKQTNVIGQKQQGYNTVYVRLLYGDMTPSQAREIASIARDYAGGRMRTSITQNILIRWVPDSALTTVYTRLEKAGIGLRNAETIADITRCPGADTCNLAITHSKGLAQSLTEKVFSSDFADDAEIQKISIKISGCTNSCGQHHIANIGFFGASRNIAGKQLPHYQMLIGGRTGLKHEDVQFGKRIAFIPARRVHEAVKELLIQYKTGKASQDESFLDWSDRIGLEPLKAMMEPFSDTKPLLETDPDSMYMDLGDDSGAAFKVSVGKGECAA